MSEIEKILEECTECNVCLEECEFLKQACETPKELADRFKAGYFREKPQIPYSCNLCHLCEMLCPQDLNIGKMCLEIRRQMVKEGVGPLPEHKKFVVKEQEWVFSDSFTLSLPDLTADKCQRVFFPGCVLSGYSPSLVLKTYDYLREKLPDTGIILGCCGAPTLELGEEAKFKEMLTGLDSKMRKLGASEIILACPYCYHTVKQYAPQLQPKSLYEVMVEAGLPEIVKTCEWVFSLHDSCKTRREENLQNSVRALISGMGHRIEEMEYSKDKTRCCGAGSFISFADSDLAKNVTKRRADEAPFDILTYCATCRETLAQEKPTIHILDLIFNPDWENDRLKPPNKALAIRTNQSLLKSKLQVEYERLKGVAVSWQGYERVKLQKSAEVTEALKSKHILDDEVKMVIHSAESRGEKLYQPEGDKFLAKQRIGERDEYKVTFYVEYSVAEENTYIVHSAYYHEPKILEE